ncbi:hypothetical protein EWE75_20910 [Sphingomonas populi]|uniref:Uncharacterized protein n=1 Tax=Sphingomonas populi TaxID=2484750 RepID=A0A4Q6XTC6_9SPHN|nr:hypothetical protein [Sphingomonas populi]RZF60822.1 hypothetical protein EWE75_20910 [Sphingomonas populi]
MIGAVCLMTAITLSTAASAQQVPGSVASGGACELHVWPTNNYLGMNSGLLSGFAVVGVLADQAAHKNRVQTVKDLMKDYLGPDIQMEELNKIGLLASLKLPATTRIVLEEPTPFNEDVKKDPALKAKITVLNQTLKAGKRLTASQSPCYSELLTTFIFYHKAMMYGSNLLTAFMFREFKDQPLAVSTSTGMVKNPLEDFPPKTPEKTEAAKIELRDAFSKDYVEWLAKKKKS